MADSDDEIYIDVIPRVDEAAADSAVGKLKDKFKDVAGNIGPDFMDALNNSGVLEDFGKKVGSALSDAVGSDVKEMSSSIGVDLEDAIGKAINKDWTGLGASLGKGLGGKLTEALGINELLGSDGIDGVIDKFHTLADTVKSLKGGDLGAGLGGASSLLQSLGLPGSGVLDDFNNTHDQITSGMTGIKELLHDFGAETAESFLAGPEAGILALSLAAGGVLGVGGAHLLGMDDPRRMLTDTSPSALGLPSVASGPNQIPTPAISVPGLPSDPRFPAVMPSMNTSDLPSFAPLDMPADPKNPAGRTFKQYDLSDLGPKGGGSANVEAQQANVSAGSATVVASSVSLGGISLPGVGAASSAAGGAGMASPGAAGVGGAHPTVQTPHGVSAVNPLDILAPMDTGHKHSTGGTIPGDSPGYDNKIGFLPDGSMVGLEGGEGIVRNSAMQQPGIASLITQLNKGYDEGTGAAGVGGDPNNTTLSTPPTTPNTAGHTGNAPIQPQQFGSGQGGGISGGGLIGAAEQAGVAAAGVAGFGGGAIAAQMAVQESNLAVQKASQSVAALATAPFETFGLGGGQMGAPQVNPMGGWVGKLIGGALGQMNSLPNLAGSVQPPKKPDQKPDDQQQPQGESPSGPTGDRDDPMHVKVTNPQTPPQGSATSALNMTPLAAGM